MLQQLNIDRSQTPEEFLHLADEILGFLIENLRLLNEIEREIFERGEVIQSKRAVLSQKEPGEEDLWPEYIQRNQEIIDLISLHPSENIAGSYGSPAEYDFLDYPDTKIFFTMQSADRAVVTVQYEEMLKKTVEFVLKKDGDTWKIDTKRCGFQDDDDLWDCKL